MNLKKTILYTLLATAGQIFASEEYPDDSQNSNQRGQQCIEAGKIFSRLLCSENNGTQFNNFINELVKMGFITREENDDLTIEHQNMPIITKVENTTPTDLSKKSIKIDTTVRFVFTNKFYREKTFIIENTNQHLIHINPFPFNQLIQDIQNLSLFPRKETQLQKKGRASIASYEKLNGYFNFDCESIQRAIQSRKFPVTGYSTDRLGYEDDEYEISKIPITANFAYMQNFHKYSFLDQVFNLMHIYYIVGESGRLYIDQKSLRDIWSKVKETLNKEKISSFAQEIKGKLDNNPNPNLGYRTLTTHFEGVDGTDDRTLHNRQTIEIMLNAFGFEIIDSKEYLTKTPISRYDEFYLLVPYPHLGVIAKKSRPLNKEGVLSLINIAAESEELANKQRAKKINTDKIKSKLGNFLNQIAPEITENVGDKDLNNSSRNAAKNAAKKARRKAAQAAKGKVAPLPPILEEENSDGAKSSTIKSLVLGAKISQINMLPGIKRGPLHKLTNRY